MAAKLTSTADLVTRISLVLFFSYGGIHDLVALMAWLGDWQSASTLPPLSVAGVAASAAGSLFMLTLAVLLVIQRPATGATAGVMPRLVALAGTLVSFAISLLPKVELPDWEYWLSFGMVLVGDVFGAVALRYMGRSFSIIPEARRPVTSGPYRLVRHPIYFAEFIAVIGFSLQFQSIFMVALLLLLLAFQLKRMSYEEAVLGRCFPEYADYARHTARLIPWIY